jgi:hypothetical protein
MWIDITAPWNWEAGVSLLGGSGPLTITDIGGTAFDVVDSTSADGIYYEYVGGVWTPTHVVGSPPADGMMPFLRYIGPTYTDIADIRITVRNRSAITNLWTGFSYLYSTFGVSGSSPPAGPYSSGETFVLSFGVDGPTLLYSDAISFPSGDLAHIYALAASWASDHTTFAAARESLFDILKIEIDATPIGDFWTDFQNTIEESGLTKVFQQTYVPGTPGQVGQPHTLSCPEPPPPGGPPGSGGSGGPPPCTTITVCVNVGHGVIVCLPQTVCPG